MQTTLKTLFLLILTISSIHQSQQTDPTPIYTETQYFGEGTNNIEFVYQPFNTDRNEFWNEIHILLESIIALQSQIKFRPVFDIFLRDASKVSYDGHGWKHYCFDKECIYMDDQSTNYITRLLGEKCLWRLEPISWFRLEEIYSMISTNDECYGKPTENCFKKFLTLMESSVSIDEINDCIYDASYNKEGESTTDFHEKWNYL